MQKAYFCVDRTARKQKRAAARATPTSTLQRVRSPRAAKVAQEDIIRCSPLGALQTEMRAICSVRAMLSGVCVHAERRAASEWRRQRREEAGGEWPRARALMRAKEERMRRRRQAGIGRRCPALAVPRPAPRQSDPPPLLPPPQLERCFMKPDLEARAQAIGGGEPRGASPWSRGVTHR